MLVVYAHKIWFGETLRITYVIELKFKGFDVWVLGGCHEGVKVKEEKVRGHIIWEDFEISLLISLLKNL